MVRADFFPTFSGKKINYNDFKADDVCIEDIVHSLSMICRFGGHCPRHYSVAEHSILVAQLVPEEFKLAALLHDATEAYVGDMVAPLKNIENMRPYRYMEDMIGGFIESKFDVETEHKVIHKADIQALYIEARSFYGEAAIEEWGFAPEIVNWGKGSSRDVLCYAPSPHDIEKQFMNAFLAYGGKK